MFNPDEFRKENKIRYSKNDCVKSAMNNYIQKRNHTTFQTIEVSKNQFHVFSSIMNELSNPNSIRYRCFNCDPVTIDNNFSKCLNWLKELKSNSVYSELEQLVGPLFCHLYLDILQAGHREKAVAFFRSHLLNVEKVNENPFIQELLTALTNDNESMKQQFRSNKYNLKLSEVSKTSLMNFVAQNCHVVFLQVLQTWFEIEMIDNQVVDSQKDSVPNAFCLNSKFEHILNAARILENEQNKLVYYVNITNVISEINSGFISRHHGIFAYNQGNVINIHLLHNLNNLSSTHDSEMIQLNAHSEKIYAMTISKNYMASSSSDGKICIYRVEEFELVKECIGHLRTVYCLKISSNELFLASGSEDHTIRLWNTSDGSFVRVFIGHEQSVLSLDFHPNCLYIFSGSSDRNIRMWNVDSASSLRLLHGSQGTIREVVCNPLGRFLVSASDDRCMRTWDIVSGKIITETKCRDAFLNKLVWSRDGALLLGSFSDKSIKIWNFKNFDSTSENIDIIQVLHCQDTIISLEYCFGTFGILTTKLVT